MSTPDAYDELFSTRCMRFIFLINKTEYFQSFESKNQKVNEILQESIFSFETDKIRLTQILLKSEHFDISWHIFVIY
jgi:hypothetical protein